MSVIVVLSYSSIYSWLLNSCMLHSPTLFFLASSQTLGSCQISHLQLLFLSDCCFSFTHTQSYTSLSGGEEGGCEISVLFSSPPVLPRNIPGNFIFSSAIPSLEHLEKKKPTTLLSPPDLLCHCLFFPYVLCMFFFPCPSKSGRSSWCCCAPSAALLSLYCKGDGSRVSPCCHDSSHCRVVTLAVLHIEGLSEHVLRLHHPVYVRSKNICLSSRLDTAP